VCIADPAGLFLHTSCAETSDPRIEKNLRDIPVSGSLCIFLSLLGKGLLLASLLSAVASGKSKVHLFSLIIA
jgi:hypothetical protein